MCVRMRKPAVSCAPWSEFTCFLLLHGSACIAFADPTYRVTPLQLPAEFFALSPQEITDAGDVAGGAARTSAPFVLPVVWSDNGVPRFLPTSFDFNQAIGFGVTPTGNVLGGVRFIDDDANTPIVWKPDGSITLLPIPEQFGAALVGASNYIVGLAYGIEGGTTQKAQIAVWRDEKLLVLHDVPAEFPIINDINARGRYVGNYVGASRGGFSGEGESFELLQWPGFAEASPTSINDADTIVGRFTREGGASLGSFIANGDSIEELPGLAGYTNCLAYGINNQESIVSFAFDGLGNEAAVLYLNGDRTPIDMNTLIDPIPGVRLVRGIDINNAGQILVEGASGNNYTYYILSPIPEPAVAGLVVFAGLARRRPPLLSISRTLPAAVV